MSPILPNQLIRYTNHTPDPLNQLSHANPTKSTVPLYQTNSHPTQSTVTYQTNSHPTQPALPYQTMQLLPHQSTVL